MRSHSKGFQIKLFCILFLLAAPTLSAAASIDPDWFISAQGARIHLNISSSMILEVIGSPHSIESLEVNLTFVPDDDFRQQVSYIRTSPSAIVDENALFTWTQPSGTVISYSLESEIDTRDGTVKVTKKIPFPLAASQLPADVRPYLEPTGNIDSSDPKIVRAASNLVDGEDDAYIAVAKIGGWVKDNVRYSLDTLTAESSQKASWVMMNREGVCDEISTLFIAMLRSVGIPARYVSGVAYTNYNNLDDFGPHAWAEVYLPGAGWVPYDITYGQFGYVDAGHVKLKDSADSNDASARYKWYGNNVKVNTNKLSIDAQLLAVGDDIISPLRFEVIPLKKDVRFGSYNIIEVRITNTANYYVTSEFIISRTDKLGLTGADRQLAVLKPGGSRSIYWLVRVANDLSSGFIYTFPIASRADNTEEVQAKFTASEDGTLLTQEQAELLLAQFVGEEKKQYSRNVDLQCAAQSPELMIGQKQIIMCTLTNTGNAYLQGVKVCIEDRKDCQDVDAGISQAADVNFSVSYETAGKRDLIVTASNADLQKTATLQLMVLDNPSISIENLSYPTTLGFNEYYKITFLLKKQSVANPSDVKVVLTQDGTEKEWVVGVLEDDREFVLNLNAQELSALETPTNVTVTYSGKDGARYQTSDGIVIKLTDVSFTDHLVMLFNKVGRELDTFDLKVLIIVAFAIGGLIGYILHYMTKKRRRELETDYTRFMKHHHKENEERLDRPLKPR